MTASPYASDAKIAEACAAIGADLIGQTEQTLLQQLVIAAAVGGGGSTPSATAWGGIVGTLSNQTDLQAALDAKLALTGGSLSAAVSVPTTASASLANARLNGVMFGASPATSNVGISSFNSALNFFTNADHSIYHDIATFRFLSSVWLGWSQSGPAAGAITELSGSLANATLQMGKASATPIDQNFKGPNGSGTNIAGGDMRIAPGQSTGNATPATVVLQGTAAGSSGSTAQTLVDVLTVVREGVIRITNIPTSSAGLSTGDIYSNLGILTIV